MRKVQRLHQVREEEELEMVGVLNGTSLLLRRQTDRHTERQQETDRAAAPVSGSRHKQQA